MKSRMVQVVVVLLLVFASTALCEITPEYQPLPADANQVMASGVADAVGVGGLAYVEYWVWDGGNGYYYYSYRIYNEEFDLPEGALRHLTIANPSGEAYVITGAGEGSRGGDPWLTSDYANQPVIVDWVAQTTSSAVFVGETSPITALFQFASKLPPSSARLTVRQGSVTTYADGLIVAPGSVSRPRSAGYWKHQYSGKGKPKELGSLPGYMITIGIGSDAFVGDLAGSIGSDMMFGADVLSSNNSSIMLAKARRQLFALWLNVASQKVSYYDTVTFDTTVVTTEATTIGEAIEQIEATIMNIDATAEALENAKDMAEFMVLM